MTGKHLESLNDVISSKYSKAYNYQDFVVG